LPPKPCGSDEGLAMLLRLLMSTGNIFLSLVLGAIALAFVGYNDPELLSYLLGWARELKAMITGSGLDPKYNIWLELLLEERQLLFMGFTIFARILLSILAGFVAFLFGVE
jgi:hypothetical protein